MDHNSGEGHNKMMWLMMLMCLAPSLFIFFSGSGISKWYIIVFLLICVGGHFLMMKLMGHEDINKKDNDKNCH
ncbi:MAG: hypothetical protein UT86_C0003G0117 [Candidatus Magasanikbacteria bacterium GW2011_GWC2_40_17]|uniref:DUF2933 domain-containing protein n=1 Tax=Candidatus Magasanikbacteria bacterium GW2011_GWA2_42_32 TaxID=1619039 RepID=A0A0G1A7K7_9BACT|nr:MAG: hypothetical protein UT86_C0003G0117 [Candidatus Magasanikbacteria bacterium GW2011_GWC2_40_17]KKS57020.1 MAG: hypothetical protein UV20_C0004G0116 [Candidatus Magasanikbacteria bacterium GW2011_GWA2_42_32]